jgi:DNA-binding SARP family transcriptional activator
VEFRLLGPLEVIDDTGETLRLGGLRPRALLAVLLLHPNHVVSIDALIDALWGESPPEAAANTVQVYIGRLRKLLDPTRTTERLATRPPGYVLHVDDDEIDIARFEQLGRRARQLMASDPRAAGDHLEQALALWRGSVLADLGYESFVSAEVERLGELRLTALEDRMTCDLELGAHNEIVAELERLVADNPLRERLAGQLMVALYRSGRQADALATYRRVRERLVEELGIDPSIELRELEQRILMQDDALRAPVQVRELGGKPPEAPAGAAEAPRDEPDSNGIRRALRVGEYLSALDQSEELLARRPGDVRVRYWRALALARAGSADELAPEIEALTQIAERESLPNDLAEDIATLQARMLKGRALAATGHRRRTLAADTAQSYEAIYKRLGRAYSCINAATMWLVAGEQARAATLATTALALTRTQTPASNEDRYWSLATEAEAHLLLGNAHAAGTALERARPAAGDDVGALATTRIQLQVVCDETGTSRDVLDPLVVPIVIHYTGHRISEKDGRFPADEEPAVASEISACLKRADVGFGYGSLASGADILFAEALLARGAELHVVLPFAVDTFLATSVSPAGVTWLGRFSECLDEATSVTIATPAAHHAREVLLAYGSSLAMGRAVMRASLLGAVVEQHAVWDGTPGMARAGTAADVTRWMASGRRTRVVPGGEFVPVTPAGLPGQEDDRVAAMLVADLVGFDRVDDADLRPAFDDVLGPLGAAMNRSGESVVDRARWGSRIWAVVDTVDAAATLARELQGVVASIDASATKRPTFGLRVLLHAAPVVRLLDPVLGRAAIVGAEAHRLMNLQLTMPIGGVYATDAFASLLMLDAADAAVCHYVGRVATPSGEATTPLYVVT